MAFTKGNVVTLNSGGPRMTVLGTVQDMGPEWVGFPDLFIVTQWFTSVGEKKIDAFDPQTLSLADPDIS